MSNSENPYAPVTAAPSAQGANWIGTDPAALAKTAFGLSLVYYGIILLLLSIILMFGMSLAPFVLITALGGLITALGGLMISAVLMFVGPIFCLSVPAETNAKGLIIATVVLQLINFLVSVGTALGVDLGQFGSFSQLINVLSAICFILFMRRLSQFLGREDLTRRAGRVLALGLATLVGGIGGIVAMFTLGGVAAILLLVVALLSIIEFIMYANLVNALSKALKSYK